MTVDQSASLVIGALSGASVAVLQQSPAGAPAVTPMIGLVVPIVSAVIGAIMGYAVLKTTVKAMEKDMSLLRQDVAHVYDLLRGMSDRIARIEGRLDA
jgi:uncharacterized membrane protein